MNTFTNKDKKQTRNVVILWKHSPNLKSTLQKSYCFICECRTNVLTSLPHCAQNGGIFSWSHMLYKLCGGLCVGEFGGCTARHWSAPLMCKSMRGWLGHLPPLACMLSPTAWAYNAEVDSGLPQGYLSGRSSGLSGEERSGLWVPR